MTHSACICNVLEACTVICKMSQNKQLNFKQLLKHTLNYHSSEKQHYQKGKTAVKSTKLYFLTFVQLVILHNDFQPFPTISKPA